MASTAGLHPEFKPIADDWIETLRSLDPRFVITSGYRSEQEQQDLWNRFQRGEGSGVFTPLPPGRSQHGRGFAIDIARLGRDARYDPVLRIVGAVWRARGFVWGGEADPVHFEAPKSLTGRR